MFAGLRSTRCEPSDWRETRQTTAVELDAITVRRDVAVLGRSEIDETIRFVHTFDRAHFPLAVSDLSQQFAVGGVVIEMLPAVALAGPDERSVFQPDRLFVDRNPRFRSFMNDVCRLAIARIGEVHVEKRLFAVLRLVNNFLAVGRPGDARDQKVCRLILERIDPANVAACGIDHTELHDRIRIAGLRISRDFDVLVIRNVIDNRELRNRRLIKTQKRDASLNQDSTSTRRSFRVHTALPGRPNPDGHLESSRCRRG